MDIFQVKRDELVGALLWGIQTNNNSVDLDGPYAINGAAISRPVFEEYRRIRERMGFETYVYNPAMWPELSAFLVGNIRKQHPELFSSTNQSSGRAKDKDAMNHFCQHYPEVELNEDVAASPGTEHSSDEPTTDLHDPMEEGPITSPGAENSPTKSNQIQPVDAVTDDTVGSMNHNDISQETGPVQCVGLKHGGLRCGRKDQKVPEAERGSWLCHLHAPGEKKAAGVSFAANTSSAAKATGALSANTVTRTVSRAGTKRSGNDESCGKDSSDVPTAKRTKHDLQSASDDLQSEDDPSQSDPIVFTVQKPLDGGEYFETDPSNPEWNFVNFTTTLKNGRTYTQCDRVPAFRKNAPRDTEAKLRLYPTNAEVPVPSARVVSTSWSKKAGMEDTYVRGNIEWKHSGVLRAFREDTGEYVRVEQITDLFQQMLEEGLQNDQTITKYNAATSQRFRRIDQQRKENGPKKEAWKKEEYEQIVQVFNEAITQHGLIDWEARYNEHMTNALEQLNTHRIANPQRFPSRGRDNESIRGMLNRKYVVKTYRERAKLLKEREDSGHEIGDEELRQEDPFKVEDFETARAKK